MSLSTLVPWRPCALPVRSSLHRDRVAEAVVLSGVGPHFSCFAVGDSVVAHMDNPQTQALFLGALHETSQLILLT